MVPLVILPMVQLVANGIIGITIGTDGITNGTIGRPLNDIGIPLVEHSTGCWSFRDLPFRDPYTFAT